MIALSSVILPFDTNTYRYKAWKKSFSLRHPGFFNKYIWQILEVIGLPHCWYAKHILVRQRCLLCIESHFEDTG